MTNPLAQERAASLSTYAPYGLTVQVDSDFPELRFTGLMQAITYDGTAVPHVALWTTDFGGARKVSPVLDVRPVLYSLADLPQLPGDPLPRLVHRMNFIATEDLGAGEYINQVTVKQASDAQLHLLVGTGYQQPDNSYHNETGDLVEDEPQDEYQAGSDYEVILSAHGDVYWRRVSAEPGQREPFQLLGGTAVLSAFELLRELQVAFGPVAHMGQARYVRKALPAQEGGPSNV